jgi:hypothetical protein
MRNLTINDATQEAILPHLKVTEELLSRAIVAETGIDGDVEITALSDLGLASNSTRMRGGFFTGMYARWQSRVPFVPVDATVNSCGVYVFTLNEMIDGVTFAKLISIAKNKISLLGYNWNFERGNHFITVGTLESGIPCVVMHASADEYKKGNADYALYPTANTWYQNEIKIYTASGNTGRFLRYLVGGNAERFIEIASKIEAINKHRLQDVSHLIFGSLVEDEYLFVSHYGMPSDSSVAIGCSWDESKYVLLTAPEKNIYIVEPCLTSSVSDVSDEPKLYPHGFGVEISNPNISFEDSRLLINGVTINSDDAVTRLPTKGIRMRDASDNDIDNYVQKVLAIHNSKIQSVIKPTMSLNSVGLI